MTYQLGDCVRIDIPNETDPDFELHGEQGLVIAIDPDHDSCDCEALYEITLENYEFTIEMHPWDLRPPIEPIPPIESLPADPAEEL
ncbi:hypothetical protein [Halalkalicoccus tibetensis]|uniref:DUF8139 domain-containing protein n=1 Tax=Halalkalicoccus tibetensis TaxID=175632 RepID=A0ABD5V6G1_9EURY